MIEAIIYRKDGLVTGFSANGHAGYASYGEDKVCSKLSMVVQGVLIGILEYLRIDCVYSIMNGMLAFGLFKSYELNDRKRLDLVLEVMVSQLKSLEKSFGKYILVKEVLYGSSEYKKFESNLYQLEKDDTENAEFNTGENIKIVLYKNNTSYSKLLAKNLSKDKVISEAIIAAVEYVEIGLKGINCFCAVKRSKQTIEFETDLKERDNYEDAQILIGVAFGAIKNIAIQYNKNIIIEEKEE